jgi:hypothetical protein
MLRKTVTMSDMTEQEVWELDELLTRTTPEISPKIRGLFIKHRNMMVILDHLSAEWLTAKMLTTKQSPTEIISNMVRYEMSLAGTENTAMAISTPPATGSREREEIKGKG